MYPQNFDIKTIQVKVRAQMVDEIDRLAKRDFMTRSEVVRLALLEYLRKPGNQTGPDASDDPALDAVLEQFHDTEEE